VETEEAQGDAFLLLVGELARFVSRHRPGDCVGQVRLGLIDLGAEPVGELAGGFDVLGPVVDEHHRQER
jgi:hypothetical protein